MRERIHALAHRTAAYFGRCCAERLFWGAWGVGSCGCVECVGVCCSEACGKGRAPRLSRDITVDVDKDRGARAMSAAAAAACAAAAVLSASARARRSRCRNSVARARRKRGSEKGKGGTCARASLRASPSVFRACARPKMLRMILHSVLIDVDLQVHLIKISLPRTRKRR